jgi:uncharacterized repeat protein (TIGR01451 family)
MVFAAGCSDEELGCAPPPPRKQQAQPAPQDCEPGGDTMAAMYLPTGEKSCSVAHVEKTGPSQVIQGKEFAYIVTVSNPRKVDLHEVKVHEELPPNFSLKGTAPQAGISGGTLIWDVGTLKAGEAKKFRVVGSTQATGELMSCTEVTYRPPQVCLTVNSINPQIQLTKSGPSESILCDAITYKLVAKNVGSGAACDVEIVDDLPDGMKTLDGETTRTYRIARLEPGQSKEYTIKTRVSKTGQYVNQAHARGPSVGDTSSNQVSTNVTTPVLVVTKDAPDARYLNRPIKYSVTVSNRGQAEAKNTVLRETFNKNVEFVSASHGGKAKGSDVMWTLGTIQPGESKTVELTVKAREKGEVSATAKATAYCGAGEADISTAVAGIPAILLETIDVADPIEVGAKETYVITVTNQGSAVDTNVQIVAMLPAEQEYASSDGPTKAKVEGKTITFEPLKELQPGRQAVWKVHVKGTGTGDVRFRTRLTSDQMTSPAEESESTHIYE